MSETGKFAGLPQHLQPTGGICLGCGKPTSEPGAYDGPPAFGWARHSVKDNVGHWHSGCWGRDHKTLEIERLRSDLTLAVEALKPFEAALTWLEQEYGKLIVEGGDVVVPLRVLRRARDTIEKIKGERE